MTTEEKAQVSATSLDPKIDISRMEDMTIPVWDRYSQLPAAELEETLPSNLVSTIGTGASSGPYEPITEKAEQRKMQTAREAQRQSTEAAREAQRLLTLARQEQRDKAKGVVLQGNLCIGNCASAIVKNSDVRRTAKETLHEVISNKETMDSIMGSAVRSIFKPPVLNDISENMTALKPALVVELESVFSKYRDMAIQGCAILAGLSIFIMSSYYIIKLLMNRNKHNVGLQQVLPADVNLIRKRDEYNARVGYPVAQIDPFPSSRPPPVPVFPDNFYKVRASNWIPSLHDKLIRNTFNATFTGKNEGIPRCAQLTYLSQHVFVGPGHIFCERQGVLVLGGLVRDNYVEKQYVLTADKIIDVDVDMVFVLITDCIPLPSLVPYLLPEDNVTKTFCDINILAYNGRQLSDLQGYTKNNVTLDLERGAYSVKTYFPTNFTPYNGLCGTLAYGSDSKKLQGIFGMHIGYHNTNRVGLILPLTIELWEKGIARFEVPIGTDFPDVQLNSAAIVGTDIGPLKAKSILRHCVGLDIIGTDNNSNPTNERPVMEYTIMRDHIPDYGFVAPTGKGFVNDKGEFRDPSLHRIAMHTRTPLDIDPDIIKWAVDDYFGLLHSTVDFESLTPWNITTTMNGEPGTMIRRINVTSSAGPTMRGTKGDYVRMIPGGTELVPDTIFWARHRAVLERISKKESCCFLHKMSPKLNEAITKDKMEAAKTRNFIVSEFVLYDLMKFTLGPLWSKMRSNPAKVESCIGVNAASTEWEGLVDVLQGTNTSRKGTFDRDGYFIDRDFVWYDVFQWLVQYILFAIIKRLESNEAYNKKVEMTEGIFLSALDILKALAYDISIVPVSVRGDIFWLTLFTASGWYCTAEINSMGESIIHRMVYLVSYKNFTGLSIHQSISAIPSFYDNVILINYGDDNVENSSHEVRHFYGPENQTRASLELGFVITDAKKTGKLSYSKLGQISFLKRSFVYDRQTGLWLAPLEEKSIHKMLTMYEPSVALSREKHCIQLILDAQRQYFMYGRNTFDEKTRWLKRIFLEHKLDRYYPFEWPTFDVLLEDFKAKHLHMGML